MRRTLIAIAALLGLATASAVDAQSHRYLSIAGYGPGAAPVALPPACTAPPALPLPVGAKLMGHGDSVLGLGLTNSNATNGVSTRMESILEAAWARNPNFAYENWYVTGSSAPWLSINPWNGANQGIAGDHMDWSSTNFGNGILPRTRYTLGRGPAIVYLQGGGNTINSGDSNSDTGSGGYNAATGLTTYGSAAYVIAKLDAAINQFTCRGVWVILQTILPDGYWPSGDVRHQTIRDVNVWIRAQVGRTGVKVIDPYNALVSPTDPDAVNQALYQEQINLGATPPVYGGVHPNQAGAWLIVRDYLGPLLDAMISPGSVFSQDQTVSNLVPAAQAAMNGGTTGTMTASGATNNATPVAPTGQTPTSWTINSKYGSTPITMSIDTSNTGYNRMVVSIAPVNDGFTGTGFLHEADVSPTTVVHTTSVAAGSWMQAMIHVETPNTGTLGDGPSTLFGQWNVFNASSATLSTERAQVEFTGLTQFPNYGRGGYWLRFAPIQVPTTGPATKSTFSFAILYPKTNPAFTVKFDRLIIRQVADPRTLWNVQ